MSNITSEIGSRIRCFRKAKDLSIEDLAEMTGYSKSALSRFENGEGNVSVEALIAIANALSVSPTLFFSPSVTNSKDLKIFNNFASDKPIHMYYYDGRLNMFVNSIIEHHLSDNGEFNATLYNGIDDINKAKASNIFTGKLYKHEFFSYYHFTNLFFEGEHLFLCVHNKLQSGGILYAITTGINTLTNYSPVSFISILSKNQITDAEVLSTLKLKRDQMSHIKSTNMLMPF